MPKISAATIKEHHELMFNALLDGAEAILRELGPHALTAGAVAERAGIARNSIYRYVQSVDDLRVLVLERYLPQWQAAVDKRVRPESDPRRQVLDLTVASLEMARSTGHSWLISVMRPGSHPGSVAGVPEEARVYSSDAVAQFHVQLMRQFGTLWAQIDPQNGELSARLNGSLLEAGMKLIDRGKPFDAVVRSVSAAISGMFPKGAQDE